ncbi:MMPL family transporter [Myxococcota bacterium]|nr:MMPL family transporter [Myxococcota bacterium]
MGKARIEDCYTNMHRLTAFSLRRPGLTFFVLLSITGALGAGAPRVEQAFGFRVLVGSEHPAIRALDSLIEQFSGGYPVRIAWECGEGHPCQSVFDEVSLGMADALTRELASAAGVLNVLSPANAGVLVSNEEGFATRRFIEHGVRVSDAELLMQRVLDDPLWVGDLISADGQVGVVVVQPSDNEPETDLRLTDTIERALDSFGEQGFSYYVVGDAPETVFAGRALAESTRALTPVAVLVIALLLSVLTRSWQQTLASLVTMGVALLWTRGVLGWLGWPQDGMLQVLAPMVLTVGVCDAVHLLSRYAAERRLHPRASTSGALVIAARDAGPACVITTLTTAVAFGSFTASDLDTFVRFGAILPVGVFACLALSFSLLPLVIDWLPADAPRLDRASAAWDLVMDAVLETSAKRAAPLLLVGTLLLGVFGLGWAVHLRADNDFMEALGESSAVVQAVRFVERRLGNSQTLELDVQLPPGTVIEDPETLRALSRFSESVSRIDSLGGGESIVDLIERLNRVLHDDASAFERVGDSHAANAELLELMAFEDPDMLNRWLSLDRSRLRVSLSATMDSRHEREAALAEVEARIRDTLPAGWQAQPTGELAIQYDWVRDIQATQLRSFPIAFGLVFGFVSFFLRSWKLGLAAMLPTLLPVVVVLGVMGWLGMSLDVARAMIAAVVIGIGVDDAVHVLRQYQLRRAAGENSHLAMGGALRHSGRAVVTTSISLALGFLALMMSAWQTVASFGFFVALAILGALAATLFLLPALVFAFSPRGSEVRGPLADLGVEAFPRPR